MGAFDAFTHAMTTVAIGGFSNHDASIGYFDSYAINAIAIIFMFLSGINFSLHFITWRDISLRHYLVDPEFRAYVVLLTAIVVWICASLLLRGHYEDPTRALMHGIFQAVSITTTTGYNVTDFSAWPGALPVLLLFGSFIGGCAGSTAGGIKVMRCLLLFRQGAREVVRLVHPSAQIPVRLGNIMVPQRVVDAVWGFFSVYIAVFAILMLLMMARGIDHITAFAAIAACLNNLGPGLAEVSETFNQLGAGDKWLCVLAMLLGRLEIFTLLVLISPVFWRR
jgi:trk system potassium uptake protein TrkH